MDLYIVDGTYELFRAHFGYPSRKSNEGKEVGALKGYINHLLSLRKNNNYLCVSFDSTVESFRNKLFTEYKSSNHIDPEILQQFSLAEEVTKLQNENKNLKLMQAFNNVVSAEGADEELTWSYLMAKGGLTDLDVDDPELSNKLGELITKAIEVKPNLKASASTSS